MSLSFLLAHSEVFLIFFRYKYTVSRKEVAHMTQYKDFDLDIVKVADTTNENGPQPRITSVSLCTFGCITGTLMCITNTCGCSTSK